MPDNDQTNTTTTTASTQAQDDSQQAGKTFTQEQLDAIIADRLQRERSKYADYDDLKRAKGELDQLKTAQLSEAEKLQKRAEEAEAEAKAAKEEAKATALRMAIEREARKLNIVDEDAAYRLLDVTAVSYGEDGNPSNVEALLQELVKTKPYLKAQTQTQTTSTTNPARTEATQPETLEEKKARLFGRPGNPFDEAFLRSKGGGVVINEE